MKSKLWNLWITLLACLISSSGSGAADGQPFNHPGLLQTRQELEFMRDKILSGEDPWKTAYDRLCAQSCSQLDFQPRAIAHIVRGPYGQPSIGDRDLMASANAAYSQALQRFVTRDPAHARKAGQIIGAWSGVLQDFAGNDAKLLAGWTGHGFCNAAEILRHTGADWDSQTDTQFRRMLLTVYYPLLKDFFAEANGNWDAAIMDTMLCMGVYCDDREMFQRAVEHFMRGAGNGGIAKYIYPNGQCEESARDQGHTQLGLGELAQACQVAWNQGVDLYGAADNRLALGVEYTARFMLGQDVPSICALSEQGRGRFSDIYEGAWQHYHFDCGMEMPWVGRVLQQARSNDWWNALIMDRGSTASAQTLAKAPVASPIASAAGALNGPTSAIPVGSVTVGPGQSIQAALDAATNGSWIALAKGSYALSAPLRVPSGVTLVGQGRQTIVFPDPSSAKDWERAAIINATDSAHDIVLRDFVLDGGAGIPPARSRPDPNASRRARSRRTAPSRMGIAFAASGKAQLRSLRLEHITVRNWTRDGVEISGAVGVVIAACGFDCNGGSVPPGPGLQHNLVLNHTDGAEVHDSRLDDSLCGSGLCVVSSRDILIVSNELARNAGFGVETAGSTNIRVRGNLAEANDGDGIFASADCDGVDVERNRCRNNGLAGIRLDGANSDAVRDNSVLDNGTKEQIVMTGPKRIAH